MLQNETEDSGMSYNQYKAEGSLRNTQYARYDNMGLTIEEKFFLLKGAWLNGKHPEIQSLLVHKIDHPAYQAIIQLGMSVVPFILNDLDFNHGLIDCWATALQIITKQNPVPEKYAHEVRAISYYWQNWGKEHGYY